MIKTLIEIIELGLCGIFISAAIWVVTVYPKSKDKKI